MFSLCFQVHSHPQRRLHKPAALEIPKAYQCRSMSHTLTRDKLELFAVLCIETSHYVSFIKYGPKNEDWIFFDSMADREGELPVFLFVSLDASFIQIHFGWGVCCVQESQTVSTFLRCTPVLRLACTWKCLPLSWPARYHETWKVWPNVSSVTPTCTCIRAQTCPSTAE